MKQNAPITFHKMHGCGNDFIFIDNRDLRLPQEHMSAWAKTLCPRAFAVGADGIIFLETPVPAPYADQADYRWHFYNSDGSRAEMCGNASRCATRLAVELGLAQARHVFLTDAGLIRAQLLEPDLAKVQLTPPVDMALNLQLDVADTPRTVHYVDSGVPHAVLFTNDAQAENISVVGPALRYHQHFAPRGANANIAQIVDKNHVFLRTYERGVEGETHACGTGAVATVFLAHALGLTAPCVDVTTSGGEVLTIAVDNNDVFLTGKAIKVYTGSLEPQALGLPLE